MAPAARSRRKVALGLASRTGGARPKAVREAIATWTPPTIALLLFLVLYVLGNVDVIDTPPALALDAFILISVVLYFPLRYITRLPPRGRIAALLLGVVWLGVVYYPIYRRIYPGERVVVADVTPQELPLELETEGAGSRFELVIDGHLERAAPGATRVAHYSVTIEAPDMTPQTFDGVFKESWLRQRQGRKESVELHQERSATTVSIENPGQGNLVVSRMTVRGQAEERLTLTVHRDSMPPAWLLALGAGGLLVSAVVYDRATGARQTAASLAIATGAALTGAYAFPSIGSPHPTFRELLGATIVGALLGGPIGGLGSWLLHNRLNTPVFKPRRKGR